MDEADEPRKTALAQAGEDTMLVEAMGGRVRLRREQTAQATLHGQIVFFAGFLAAAGVFDRWATLLRCISQRIADPISLPTPHSRHADQGWLRFFS
jgi:hypothetical protein